LTGLQDLCFGANQISDISILEKLIGLKSLVLAVNQISDISILEKLTGLQSLDLSNNQISDISILEKLTGLQSLDLRGNQISDISPLLPLIKSGFSISTDFSEKIRIGGNPITTPPQAIIKKGSKAIISWFEQIEKDGEAPLYEAKLMILGQGGAGKTTFARLQLDPNYKVKPGKLDSTLGIDVHKGKEFQHKTQIKQIIKAHLWDFGGQDIQKMLHQFFITENCLYVLVSDKRAENTNFDYWFQIVQLLGPQSHVIVLENPKDIHSTTDDFALNKYKELFKDLHIESISVNLKKIKEKSDNVRWQLLNDTIEKHLSEMEIVNRPVPKKWRLIRDELEKAKSKKYISKDDFHNICQKTDINLNHEQADLCIYYLRSLGDLVYFDDRDLCTQLFLDHNWLTKGMYYILDDPQIKKNNGLFTRKQAYEQWHKHGYNENEKAMLLRLLLKDNFDICYELEDEKDNFITPLLLPGDKPTAWEHETNLYFRFQYGFMPHGIFSRLIVQVHEKIEKNICWKSGVRLIDTINGKSVRAEVQHLNDPQDNQPVIDIRINGHKEGCKELLSFIRAAVIKLHKNFKTIGYQEKVACNCQVCKDLLKQKEKPSFFDYKKLQAKILKKRYYEECEKSGYNEISIGEIFKGSRD